MKTVFKILGVLTAFALLAGCGAGNMAVRPDATTNIQRIALITVSEPEAYVAQDLGSPGMMFGGIGGAIAGASSANAGKNVDQIADEGGFNAGERFTQLLEAKLSDAGYQVSRVTVSREKRGKLLAKYDAVDAAGADAILDVAIESMGYATEHPMFSPHWRPASQVKVALVDARTGNKIYVEKFMYGYHNPFMSGTDLDAPSTYQFKNKDALFADAAKLIAGMDHSVEAVTDRIRNNLKK